MISKNKSLKQKVLSSSVISICGQLSSQLIRLVSNLILTRLLVPEMFGLMVIASTIINGLQFFSELGLQQNLIQSKRGEEPKFVNSIWCLQIVRGVIIFLSGVLLGGIVYILNLFHFIPSGTVYSDPDLPVLICLVSSTSLILGFNSTNNAYSIRTLNMRKKVVMDITAQLIAISVTVTWAYFDRTVWALISGSIVSSLFILTASHIYLDGVSNKFEWDKQSINEIFHFGKWIFVSSILSFVAICGDKLILGGLLTTQMLGLYSTAFLLSNALNELLLKLSSNVGLPAISEIYRSKPDKLKFIYYRLRIFFDFATLLAAGFLYVSGKHIVEFLYDSRYQDAGGMLEVLSISLIFTRFNLAEQCYVATGKTKITSYLILARTFGVLVFIPLAYQYYGFYGALWTIALNGLFSLPISIYYKIKNNIFDIKRELIVLPLFAIGLGVGNAFNYFIK